MAEDGGGEQFVRGLTPLGQVFDFARNALSSSEFAGVGFSSDGRAMFVNMQNDGLTFVIRGPFESAGCGVNLDPGCESSGGDSDAGASGSGGAATSGPSDSDATSPTQLGTSSQGNDTPGGSNAAPVYPAQTEGCGCATDSNADTAVAAAATLLAAAARRRPPKDPPDDA